MTDSSAGSPSTVAFGKTSMSLIGVHPSIGPWALVCTSLESFPFVRDGEGAAKTAPTRIATENTER